MAEIIKYSMSFQVVGGPSVPVADKVEPEAYSKIQVTIPDSSTDLVVNLQPTGTKLAQFLLIKSSKYGSAAELTYKVNNTAASAISLNAVQVFIGQGAVAMLDSDPTKLLFSNSLGEDVTIDILLGRDATP